MQKFVLKSQFDPAGDQANAISKLNSGLDHGLKHQTLLGVTGSGKTFTMANIIAQQQKPVMVLAHNKTLAAQLYAEFKALFPQNAVRYFVSYYDYYQPEAYVPQRDLYIEKESDINETIELYRNAATQSLLTRRDTLIVASVSCIYGLGNPDSYLNLSREIKLDEAYKREKLLRHLADMQYTRSEYDFYPGTFRVRGDTVDVFLTYEDLALRVEYFGDQVESIKLINPISGEVLEKPKSFTIFPAKQFVTPYETLKAVIPQIEADLSSEVAAFKKQGKVVEAQRLEQRVKYDIEMLRETGYCSGIENYSRYIENRPIGSAPSTLLDYMPDDWLLFIDESHMTVPQVRAMFNGDKARKETLVNFGFRLRAALDNRPLRFSEFSTRLDQVIYVSATPDEYEIDLSKSETTKAGFNEHSGVVEQLIRPTGLVDPVVIVRPIENNKSAQLKKQLKELGFRIDFNPQTNINNQIDDLLSEIKLTIQKGQRVLVTTLTKRMAEDLSAFLRDLHIKVQYIHSDVDTVERVEILNQLREGMFDVLVGINLLREGLDLPEVSLVAILDADKEGFLRSPTSLIQTSGRAARHLDGRVIMYADRITGSMKAAISETMRRRATQLEYNQKHSIEAKSVKKEIRDILIRNKPQDQHKNDLQQQTLEKQAESYTAMNSKQKNELIKEIEVQMNIYADMLEFEKAAKLRDLIKELKSLS